jgi:hypothetical protein
MALESRQTMPMSNPHDPEAIDMRLGDHDQQEELQPFLVSEEANQQQQLPLRFLRRLSRTWREAQAMITSEHGVGIFKCSLAYLLASLAVFIPFVGKLLGQQNGKHLVATITIYFHPARSQGSMYKALICAFVAFLFATFLSLASMWVTITFHRKHDLIEIGHAVVLVVFVMGGFGFIGWIKQRLQDPLVNVACSLASLASILVITKEGAVQAGDLSFTKISQILRMLLLGIGVSTAVSLSIIPVSARKKFRREISTLTGTISMMLMSITESFLRGTDRGLKTADFAHMSAQHDKLIGQLNNLLGETKFEHYAAGTKRERFLEKSLVCSMQDITHSLGSLRSVVALQSELLAQTKHTETSQLPKTLGHFSNLALSETSRLASESPVVARIDTQNIDNESSALISQAAQQSSSILSPAEIIEQLKSRLGTSIVGAIKYSSRTQTSRLQMLGSYRLPLP